MSLREPAARAYHSAAGVDGKLFVWAGLGAGSIQTTTLESFNVSALTWEQSQRLNGPLPDGLNNAAVTDNAGVKFYSCGGHTPSGLLNTLYEMNPHTLLCRELLPHNPSYAPQKHEGSRSVFFKNKLVIYGGDTSEGRTDDLHVFDLDKGEYGAIQHLIGIWILLYIIFTCQHRNFLHSI